MKKLIALILALAMAFSLIACTNSSSKAPVDNDPDDNSPTSPVNQHEDPYADVEKRVVVGIAQDPGSFIPWGGFSMGTRNIFPMLYQTLISDIRDPETGNIRIYYVLLESFEKVDDTTYMLYLREGIHDTDGNPFTASDVCYCFDGFKAGPSGSTLAKMTAYEAINELTVKVTVSESLGVGEFEEMLTTPNMLTQAAYEASPDEMQLTPVGTTGYRLAEYVPGSYVIMEATGNYWNEAANESKDPDDGYLPTSDTTKLDIAEFQIITDTSTMSLALETGSIDIATSVATSDVSMYSEGGALAQDYTLFSYPDNMFGLIFNSSESSVMNNINFRKAVAYSINAQDLLDMIYDGAGYILKAFAMDYQIGYVQDWDNRDYFSQDLTKAKQYLDAYYKETGTSAADVHLDLICMSTDAMSKYAQVVQAAVIKLIGNEDCCKITQYDNATYGTMRKDPEGFDLAIFNAMSNKTYLLYNWSVDFDAWSSNSQQDICLTGDTHLWDLCSAAMQPETFDDEHVDAFQTYLNEQCYFVNYICGPAYWAGSNFVQTWHIGAKNSCAICAMDYDWSLKA